MALKKAEEGAINLHIKTMLKTPLKELLWLGRATIVVLDGLKGTTSNNYENFSQED